jgi:hypothetical protein
LKFNTTTGAVGDDDKPATDKENEEAFIARCAAFERLFDEENQDARLFMAWLSKFCRITESEYHPDSREHARYAGRREVALTILDHIHADPKRLYRIFNRGHRRLI